MVKNDSKSEPKLLSKPFVSKQTPFCAFGIRLMEWILWEFVKKSGNSHESRKK